MAATRPARTSLRAAGWHVVCDSTRSWSRECGGPKRLPSPWREEPAISGLSHLLRFLLVTILCAGLAQTAGALECPDYITEDWDDKPTCAWLRNDTDKTLTFGPFVFYASSGDYNDDYWMGGVNVLRPGELKVVVAFDSDGWGAFNWDTAAGASAIYVDGVLAGYLHMLIDLGAGVVQDFEYSIGQGWVDGFDQMILNTDGEFYTYTVQDKWNYDRAVFDVFFTISSQVTAQGNMGYVPPDTRDDPTRLNIMSWNTYLLIGPTGFGAKQDYCERAARIANNAHRIFANVTFSSWRSWPPRIPAPRMPSSWPPASSSAAAPTSPSGIAPTS